MLTENSYWGKHNNDYDFRHKYNIPFSNKNKKDMVYKIGAKVEVKGMSERAVIKAYTPNGNYIVDFQCGVKNQKNCCVYTFDELELLFS